MPLLLLPLRENDIPTFAALDSLAMASSPLALAMTLSTPPGAPSRQETIGQWARQGITKSDTAYLKVVDTALGSSDDGGEMIAAAIWSFREEGYGIVGVAKEITGEGGHRGEEPPAAAPPIMTELSNQFTAFLTTTFSNRAFASKSLLALTLSLHPSNLPLPTADLNILITHPSHRHRGAGSMLVKWGIDEADQRGIISVLQASEMGLGCYLKQGFEVVKEVFMDLKPFGVDEVEVRRNMIRRPKPLGKDKTAG